MGRAVLELIHIYVLCSFDSFAHFVIRCPFESPNGFFERTPRLFLNKSLQKLHFGSIILKFESKHGQIFSFIFMVFSGLWHQFGIHFSLGISFKDIASHFHVYFTLFYSVAILVLVIMTPE